VTSILNKRDFMKFPMEIGASGASTSDRRRHVREQIEQVLYTLPRERWYHPEFGVGVRSLVFETNNLGLAEVTRKRLLASLSDALEGEVVKSSLEVKVENIEEKLEISIGYMLAALQHRENMKFILEANG
jgi:hypothetical protein